MGDLRTMSIKVSECGCGRHDTLASHRHTDYDYTAKPSQQDRILKVLQDAGDRGMCSVEPVRWSPPILRTAARVADLKAAGHVISAAKCDNGDHGNSYAVRYTLIEVPA